MQPVTYHGNAAVLVDSRFPHVELDLQRSCTSHQEVVGVTLRLHQREVVVVSVYVRPSVQKTAQIDWSWLDSIRKTRPGAERPVPPMPDGLPRATQTLVRRLATNTAFSPALRHKFYGNDPTEGLCLQCRVPATAAHLVWHCHCYTVLRDRTLHTLPEAIRPTSYFDWVLPLTRDITTLTLLWTSLAAFVYADEGLRGVLGNYRRHSHHPTRPP
ncbi:hypothetical protein HPB48_023179 [Haemaphysalis longicornis]|uniref:Uncharacterized protein n=1 Tax=Haemaphysalis longicornis TaxID=44386 RepID=A0A9J6H6Y8_HAELO|nr:hypothetical protein HPB48_023179 [Haemaphysalis longicornis]